MAYADAMVKQGNPDYDGSSRSGFLRSRGMARLFNMFCSAVALYAARHGLMLAVRRPRAGFPWPAACAAKGYEQWQEGRGTPLSMLSPCGK